jgi:hypothetical protein
MFPFVFYKVTVFARLYHFFVFNFTTFVASKKKTEVKKDNIEHVFNQFSEINVLVIGDAMVEGKRLL